MSDGDLLHVRVPGTSLVLDARGPRLPRVLHWGADLGSLDEVDLDSLVQGLAPPTVSNTMDDPVPVALLPEQSAGWLGTPGVSVHRGGRNFSTAFTTESVTVTDAEHGATSVVVRAEDRAAGIGVLLEVEVHPPGLIRARARIENRRPGVLDVEAVVLTLPVPGVARELLDLTGRHLRERSPQRAPFTVGTHLRENRRGRTGTDASLVVAAGEPGFGFRDGAVWAVHVGWSGNHCTLAEATPGGERLLAGGELLLPGEVRLAEQGSYRSPWVYFAHGQGLDAVSAQFHRYLRARTVHPSSPRLVTLNSWEAVYFDQDPDRLIALAHSAAELGVERFVLDDGWFRGRRDDSAGLGDWYVDTTRWPDGLHPLADAVVSLGMQLGLWVEPEMVNLDSDLARAHPDWILTAEGRLPPLSRGQQVLDLAQPEAFAYLLERLDALLLEYPIGYLKWDHNRDLVDAGSALSGRASVHEQTLAVYALMDELLRRHPDLEIESCSSGGGRVDLGVLQRTHRVWASDCIDPVERQQIQRWTGLLIPPELMGCHVGAPTAHTTGRTHTVDFRAGTAFFGHFGIEWDLAEAGPEDRERLARWIRVHQALRPLLHTGTVVRSDHGDPSLWVHGVVAHDQSEAVYAVVQMTTSVQSPPGPVALPGLDGRAHYRVTPLEPGDRIEGPGLRPLPWWSRGITVPGSVLTRVGLAAPVLFPERLVLLRVVRVDPEDRVAAGQ